MADNQPQTENMELTKDEVIRLLDLGRLLKSVLTEEELCDFNELHSQNKETE